MVAGESGLRKPKKSGGRYSHFLSARGRFVSHRHGDLERTVSYIQKGEPQFGVGRLQHRLSTIVFSAFKEMVAGVGLLAASLPVGISVQPHVVPTHRDHGT
ncbi:hypothetical protein ISCGN_031363, partial [Ixodes scapularis]